ncbi:hypothetical protein OF83DRAFT_1060179 [Amylostereum chailletii]|nr:hypothetical protein OF83DRAFT_1060179 [Amylostereum chailletii]
MLGAGSLTHFCPACALPEVNLAPGWEADPDQFAMWKFMRSFVMDGNFSAEHLRSRAPEDDVVLADGTGYMVATDEYEQRLASAPDEQKVSLCLRTFRPEPSDCHVHRAVTQSNADKANLDVTGIGAIACSRQGFFAPHAAVNFSKGEKYKCMDYSLSNALKYTLHGATTILLLYDIMCQYGVNLRRRFQRCLSLLGDLATRFTIKKGVDVWHIQDHVEKCFARFTPSFLRGAGHQDRH